MALADKLSIKIIKAPLESSEKSEVIRELVDVLLEAGLIEDAEAALDVVIKREESGSTGLGMGIAVPHAKTDMVPEFTLALGVAPEGIDFDSLDGQPAKLFFLILVPPNMPGPHSDALMEIARISMNTSLLNTLCAARSAEEVLEAFAGS